MTTQYHVNGEWNSTNEIDTPNYLSAMQQLYSTQSGDLQLNSTLINGQVSQRKTFYGTQDGFIHTSTYQPSCWLISNRKISIEKKKQSTGKERRTTRDAFILFDMTMASATCIEEQSIDTTRPQNISWPPKRWTLHIEQDRNTVRPALNLDTHRPGSSTEPKRRRVAAQTYTHVFDKRRTTLRWTTVRQIREKRKANKHTPYKNAGGKK